MRKVTLSEEDFQFLVEYARSGWHSDCASGFYESGDLQRIEAIEAELNKQIS